MTCRTFQLISFAALLVALCSPPAFACDCNPAPVDQAIRSADLVVSGIVTSVRLVRADQLLGEAATIVEVSVQRSWKGTPASKLILHTQRNLSSCNCFEFVVGDRYLVFASRNSATVTQQYGLPSATLTYGVTLCGGTSSGRNPITMKREHQLAEILLR